MNLNDLTRFRELDSSNVIVHLDALSDYLQAGFAAGKAFNADTLPAYRHDETPFEQMVICAVGSAALAADGVVSVIAAQSTIAIVVNRTAELPAWVAGEQTLVVGLLHSAITEAGHEVEVNAALDRAAERGATIVLLSLELTTQANHDGWIQIPCPVEQPQFAFGFYIGALLGLMQSTGIAAGLEDEIQDAVAALERSKTVLRAESIVAKNAAKRLAGQMIGRTPIIYGAGLTSVAARRWKQMLNLVGKTLATAEELPDLNYYAAEGFHYPQALMSKFALVFLTSDRFAPDSVPVRWDLTRAIYLENGVASDTVKGRGESRLAHLMTLIQFGDYVSYYVAMWYGVDPGAMHLVNDLRDRLHVRLNAAGSAISQSPISQPTNTQTGEVS